MQRDTRRQAIRVAVREEELRFIREMARLADVSVSEAVRRCIFGRRMAARMKVVKK